MFLFILLLVVLVFLVLCAILKTTGKAVGAAADGLVNAIDPKLTDVDAGALIAGSAQKVINIEFPASGVRVIEFIPTSKTLPIGITDPSDIELLKAKGKSSWEIDSYQKVYWDGTLILDLNEKRIDLPTRAAVYTDKEGRGGVAKCGGLLDLAAVQQLILDGRAEGDDSPILTHEAAKARTDAMLGFWKLIKIVHNGKEQPMSPRGYDVQYIEIQDTQLRRYNWLGKHLETTKWVLSAKGLTIDGFTLKQGNELWLSNGRLLEHSAENGDMYEYIRTEGVPTGR